MKVPLSFTLFLELFIEIRQWFHKFPALRIFDALKQFLPGKLSIGQPFSIEEIERFGRHLIFQLTRCRRLTLVAGARSSR